MDLPPTDSSEREEAADEDVDPADDSTTSSTDDGPAPRNAPGECDVFISYARQERAQCDVIYKAVRKRLRRKGYVTWRDESLNDGEYWWDQITEKLAEASCFILLMSNRSILRPFIRKEIRNAINRQANNEDRFTILVFLLEKIRPQTIAQLGKSAGLMKDLETYQWINGEGGSWEDSVSKLVNRLDSLLPGKESPVRPTMPQRWSERLQQRFSDGWEWIKKKYRKSAVWALPVILCMMLGIVGPAYYYRSPIQQFISQLLRPPESEKIPEPPVPTFSNHGVVEIATRAVRGFTARLVRQGDGALVVSNEAPPVDEQGAALKREFKHPLTYTPAERSPGRRILEVHQFDASSVEQVVEDVRTTIALMEKVGVKKDDIWVVVSSGVSQIPKSALPDEKTARAEGWESPKEVADACVVDLIKRVRDKAGDVQDVRAITPLDEATYLLREVFLQNEKPQRDLASSINEVGDAVVIDVGSGDVKGAYLNPGLGKFEGPQIDGIRRDIPGTIAFERRAAAEFARDARGGNPAELSRMYKTAAAELVGKPLKDEYNNISMLGESRRVYLAGGAVWLMCRLIRPDADLDARYVLLKDPKDPDYFGEDDFTRLRDRLISEGEDAFEYPPPAVVGQPHEPMLAGRLRKLAGDPTHEARYRKELQAVRTKFNRSQRLAAAEILNAIDDSLLRITKREVYFVNNGLFDYLASYLLERVNEREVHNRGRHPR